MTTMSEVKEATFEVANMAFQLSTALICLGQSGEDVSQWQVTYVELANFANASLGDFVNHPDCYIDEVTLGHALLEFWNCLKALPNTGGDRRKTEGFGWKKKEHEKSNAVIVPAAMNGADLRKQSYGYKYKPRTQGTSIDFSTNNISSNGGDGSSSANADSLEGQLVKRIYTIAVQLLKSKKMILPEDVHSLSTLYSPQRVEAERKANFPVVLE